MFVTFHSQIWAMVTRLALERLQAVFSAAFLGSAVTEEAGMDPPERGSPAMEDEEWSTDLICAWLGFSISYSRTTLGSKSLGSAAENRNICAPGLSASAEENIAVREIVE